MKPFVALLALLLAAPLSAQDVDPITEEELAEEPATLVVTGLRPSASRVPPQLSPPERAAYRAIFRDIGAGRLSAASAALEQMQPGLLHPTAQAQILLKRGVGAGQASLLAWLEANPAAPQARDIAALARRAGAVDLPLIAGEKTLIPVRLTPSMGPRTLRGETVADSRFASEAKDLISRDQAAGVEALLDRYGQDLTAAVRSEWASRAAWDLYLELDDIAARRLAQRAANGSGDWAAFGSWVAGLAAFRQNDCEGASQDFDRIGRQFANDELTSAGAFWAARSHVRCRRPEMAAERLAIAARRDPTGFYGLLAERQLGLTPKLDWREPDFITADWTTLSVIPGARRAAALAEVGEYGLADRELKHIARTTPDQYYEPILRLAARLDLPATQYWLAANPPAGLKAPMAARFPTPDWRPINGWRVDRNLVFAHAMQESRFITTAKSSAGARGLMQIMPGTARDLSKILALPGGDPNLSDPSFNVELGQTYLEQLRDAPQTMGLLPKVIAAYNAGPGSVGKWNMGDMRYNNDVLLFIESIPFRETRHYVEVVMRNYWLYEMKAEANGGQAPLLPKSTSLTAVASNLWPRFPGLPGARAVPFPGAPAMPR
jgi:soluble lytic murein transglycosylase-like protein